MDGKIHSLQERFFQLCFVEQVDNLLVAIRIPSWCNPGKSDDPLACPSIYNNIKLLAQNEQCKYLEAKTYKKQKVDTKNGKFDIIEIHLIKCICKTSAPSFFVFP